MPRRNEIPEGIRSKVVDLHNAGMGYKLISKSLELHHSTVRKIIHKWIRFNTVATLPRSGRPTKKLPSRTRTAQPEEVSRVNGKLQLFTRQRVSVERVKDAEELEGLQVSGMTMGSLTSLVWRE